jgi:arsenate reductase-like glutaredoxin family protein
MDAPSVEEMRMRREVLALREALENAQVEHDVHHSRATSAHRGELEELHSMIRSLRELIDSERASSTQALASSGASSQPRSARSRAR